MSYTIRSVGAATLTRGLEQRFKTLWERTDRLFALVAPDAILARPIALRHPFIFYIGHLPAFAWNHVCRGLLKRTSFNPRFDEMFDRGIDPDVDDPTKVHAHPEVPDEWPALRDVLAYRARIRAEILGSLDEVLDAPATSVMAEHGRVLLLAREHEQMHQETLLYMLRQLPLSRMVRPALAPLYALSDALRARTIDVDEGNATLGADFEDLDFGWDNEFSRTTVAVPAFRIDSTPVTNGEFLDFVETGAYERPVLWADGDWTWKEHARLRHPTSWKLREGEWLYRALLDELPLASVRDWPAYVSLAEARAYARWRGSRLPTEAEFDRAAYGEPGGGERTFPWGDAEPTPAHGNFHFAHWSPLPVGSHPAGASAWGVHELVGNGWEWTESAFAPLPGFHAYIPNYPGYSADFFDGKHYVLKGASWATDAQLIRRSFRNWYQARYPYVFAKFRCVLPT
jgi:ergothioneine biosynthesis protein EgtB